MSADRFEYRDLALTVDRGKVGQPSTVTLDWVTVDQDGQEHDRKLVLGCELLIDKVERCRELTIVSVSGDADAVAEFNAYLPSDRHNGQFAAVFDFVEEKLASEHQLAIMLLDIDYQYERMADVADGMGRAILHGSIKDEYPALEIKRCA